VNGVVVRTAAQQLADQRAAIQNGSFRFALRKNFVELGIRDELFRRETYRAVVGVRGEFNDDWSYEISGNYGEHRESNRIQGNINRQRFLLAIDAAVDPATGQIRGRSQIDPRFAGTDIGKGRAAWLPRTRPCSPPTWRPAFRSIRSARVRPPRPSATISRWNRARTARSPRRWPAATCRAISASSSSCRAVRSPLRRCEYRRETVEYDLDDITQAGYAFYNAIPSFTAPSFQVKEAFGELSIPLLKDMPGFEELTITGSGRISDYKGSAGTTYAYGVEGVWRPIQDIASAGPTTAPSRSEPDRALLGDGPELRSELHGSLRGAEPRHGLDHSRRQLRRARSSRRLRLRLQLLPRLSSRAETRT
jgi:hypothetical protein